MVSQFASRYCLEQFTTHSFDISTFETAEAALERFKKDGKLPDIIFLDIGLDKMNGWQFLEELQKLLHADKMPEIYVLSAFGNSNDRKLAQEHPNVHGYVDKPLTRNRLEVIFNGAKA